MLLYSEPGFGLSERQLLHIQYSGAASITGGNAVTFSRGGINHASIYSNYEKYGWDLATFIQKTPSLNVLIKAYSDNKVESVSLTSVGRAIALAYLSTYMGTFDYTPWLD